MTLWWLSVFAQADSCPACGEAPEGVASYVETMFQMIQLLPIDSSGNQQSVDQNIRQSLQEQVESRKALTIAVSNEITTSHLWAWTFDDLSMAYNTQSVQRERRTFEQVQAFLQHRIHQMAWASRHNDTITQEDMDTFNDLLQQLGYVRLRTTSYLTEQGTSDEYNLKIQGSKYTDMAKILWQFHHMMKALHQVGWYRGTLQHVWAWTIRTNHPNPEIWREEYEREQLDHFAQQLLLLVGDTLWKNTVSKDTNALDFLEFTNQYSDFFAHVRQVQDDYQCSVWLSTNVCNEAWQNIRQQVAEVFEQRVNNDMKQSWNSMKESWWRLKAMLWMWTSEDKLAYRQRKTALANAWWWRDTEQDGKLFAFSPSSHELWKNIQDSYKKSSDYVGAQVDTIKKFFQEKKFNKRQNKVAKHLENSSLSLDDNPFAEDYIDRKLYDTLEDKKSLFDAYEIAQEALARYEQNESVINNFRRNLSLDQRAESLKDVFASVLVAQEEMVVSSVFTDVRRTTTQFPALSKVIYKNMDMLWKKNDENWMYYAMGQVCELQCSNLNWKKCWDNTL